MRLFLITIILVSAVVAAEPPRVTFTVFATQLTREALSQSKGTITDEQFRGMATSLLKYLEGDAASGEKLFVRIRDPLESPEKDKIVVLAGYDRGMTYRAYDFVFLRRAGILHSVTIVPSE